MNFGLFSAPSHYHTKLTLHPGQLAQRCRRIQFLGSRWADGGDSACILTPLEHLVPPVPLDSDGVGAFAS